MQQGPLARYHSLWTKLNQAVRGLERLAPDDSSDPVERAPPPPRPGKRLTGPVVSIGRRKRDEEPAKPQAPRDVATAMSGRLRPEKGRTADYSLCPFFSNLVPAGVRGPPPAGFWWQ